MPKKKLHCIVVCQRKGFDQLVNTWQLFVVIRKSWKKHQMWIYHQSCRSNYTKMDDNDVCWIKNGIRFFQKSLLMAETNLLKWLKGKRGSGSSLKNNFSAPVMTWTSSHWPSSRSSSSVEAQHMHLTLQGSRGQRCLRCRPPLTTKFIYNFESIS